MHTVNPIIRKQHNFGRIASMMCVLVLATLFISPRVCRAESNASSPSVLFVDSGLGDAELCRLRWLDDSDQVAAEDANRKLYRSDDPSWWEGDDSPSTFLLTCSGKPLEVTDISWALDGVSAAGAQPRAFIVAVGPTGLLVREYIQDLATPRQSSRADVVGVAFLGTPHNGYAAMSSYPKSELWDRLSSSIGHAPSDLAQNSAYIQNLNAGTFPRAIKSLILEGTVGDLGFGITDGAGTSGDFALPQSVSSQVERTQVEVTIGRAMNLTGLWQQFTSSIDYPDQAVDSKLTERLSAMESYETSPEAQRRVREFYKSWFAGRQSVTHASYVMLLDLSGSMVEPIDSNTTKLNAAKQAAKEYLHSMDACQDLPLSPPMDVSVIGFAESTVPIANGHDKSAIEAIDGTGAQGETNIGLALDAAMKTFESSPVCATKRILLLSDGASTRGKSEEQLFSETVARAKELGIAIDTIGFGDVGESNAGFLTRLSSETGGNYYAASDTYSLRVDFLKSYYSTLGSDFLESELQQDSTAAPVIADDQTLALQIGIVSESDTARFKLLLNGQPIDENLYNVSSQNGATSIQCMKPSQGEYSVQVSDGTGKLHLFSVRQQGIAAKSAVASDSQDNSLMLIGLAGAVLVVGIIIVIFATKRKS